MVIHQWNILLRCRFPYVVTVNIDIPEFNIFLFSYGYRGQPVPETVCCMENRIDHHFAVCIDKSILFISAILLCHSETFGEMFTQSKAIGYHKCTFFIDISISGIITYRAESFRKSNIGACENWRYDQFVTFVYKPKKIF